MKSVAFVAVALLLACSSSQRTFPLGAKEAPVAQPPFSVAGLVPGMPTNEAEKLLSSWGATVQRGESRSLPSRNGGAPIQQTPLRFSGPSSPLGAITDGFAVFDNDRLVRIRVRIDAPLTENRLEPTLGTPTLSWPEGRTWHDRTTRAFVQIEGTDRGHSVEFACYGTAIAEGELTDAFYQKQVDALEDARRARVE